MSSVSPSLCADNNGKAKYAHASRPTKEANKRPTVCVIQYGRHDVTFIEKTENATSTQILGAQVLPTLINTSKANIAVKT